MAKILLIAGHGDGEPGACAGGVCEADLTREVARGVQKRLGDASELFDTSKNLYRLLKNGGTYDFSGYDYILEIHFNAGAVKTSNGATTGSEMLIKSGKASTDADRLILGKLSAVGFRNRGVKGRSDLQNMNIITRRGNTYALLEVCFIDDPDDMRILNAKKTQVIEAIADGITEGFGIAGIKELESVNDIVWELGERGIITDKALWLKKLEEDANSYWLARKTVKYIREKRI